MKNKYLYIFYIRYHINTTYNRKKSRKSFLLNRVSTERKRSCYEQYKNDDFLFNIIIIPGFNEIKIHLFNFIKLNKNG